MNPSESSSISDNQNEINFGNNHNLDFNKLHSNLGNLFEDDGTNIQDDYKRILNDEDDFQSIFSIESKYHDAQFSNKSKHNLPKSKKICLDPPCVYAFKEIVGVPSQIKKQNIKIEQFLKARIALEKKLDIIGLDIEHDSSQSASDIASAIADEILALQNYKIQNTQKELNQALMAKDVYMQQPDLISPNDINPCRESKLVCLDEINSTFQPKAKSNDDFQTQINEICRNYDDSTFDVYQAISLLQELS